MLSSGFLHLIQKIPEFNHKITKNCVLGNLYDTINRHANLHRYGKHRFVCTVDRKSKNTSRFAIKLFTNTLSFPFSFKNGAKLFASPYHKKRSYKLIHTWNGGINHAIEICVHGRWKIRKHQSIHHEILILFIVNVYSTFF